MFENQSPLKFRGDAAKGQAGQQGFTLIEMSIVLVIIGLIIGGIVKGEEVVNGARLKVQMSQVDAIKGAVFAFQDKFGFLPGDYQGSNLGLGALTASNGGNQDGTVDSSTATFFPDGNDVSGPTSEAPTAWIELAATNLLAGVTLLAATATTQTPTQTTLASAATATYAGKAGNSYLWFATFSTGWGVTANMVRLQQRPALPGAILREQDASTIDSKFDDGSPGTGDIQTVTAAGVTGCTNSSTAGATYSLGSGNSAALACALDFVVE